MISGANEQELANARANIVMKLDNTSTYESWLIVDSYLGQLEKENQELKKQLEELEEDYFKLSREITEYTIKLHKNKVQRKEFIKYLEDEIKELQRIIQRIKETELDYDILKDVIPQLLACKTILQKYKEIIGVLDDKESKEN